MKCSLGISNFLEEISSLSHSVVFLYFFPLIADDSFLISPCYFWNSAFRCLYLSFSPLLLASLLFTAICKASSDSQFAFLHVFFLGMVVQVWPFRYDLNQIPYDYTVEVRNKFKGLDLIDRVPDELWMEVRDIVRETGIKTIPKKKKCEKSKMAVWRRLTNSCEKKRSQKQRRKGKIYPCECRVPKNSKER